MQKMRFSRFVVFLIFFIAGPAFFIVRVAFSEINRGYIYFSDGRGNRIFGPKCKEGESTLFISPMTCAPTLDRVSIPEITVSATESKTTTLPSRRLIRCVVKYPPKEVKVTCSWNYHVDGGFLSIVEAVKKCEKNEGNVYAHRLYNSAACDHPRRESSVQVSFLSAQDVTYDVEDFGPQDIPQKAKTICINNLFEFDKVAVKACNKAPPMTIPQKSIVGQPEGEPDTQYGTACCKPAAAEKKRESGLQFRSKMGVDGSSH